MNSLVALPIAAALPTAAPSLPAAALSKPPALADDSELLDLVERFIVAERRYCTALVTRDDLLDRNDRPLPEALRVRPRDIELGKKLRVPTDEHWRRPCDIGQWRVLETFKTECYEDGECSVFKTTKIPPAEELRARGEEIVAAFEAWNIETKPRGYRKAERAARKAEREYHDLQDRIVQTPTSTITGMLAKIRSAEADEKEGFDRIDGGGFAEAIALSIFEDIRRMAGNS